MRAFVFATPMEAGPFVIKCGASLPQDAVMPLVVSLNDNMNAEILITGMGPEKARTGLLWYLSDKKPEVVINAGIAGALKDHYSVGDMLQVNEVLDLAEKRFYNCSSFFSSDLKETSLVTVNEPVFDADLRRKLAVSSDIVDMEGAVYAGLCLEKAIPFAAIKCISDMAGNQGRESLLKHLNLLSQKLADYLFQNALFQ